jgi:hypothetical protein
VLAYKRIINCINVVELSDTGKSFIKIDANGKIKLAICN